MNTLIETFQSAWEKMLEDLRNSGEQLIVTLKSGKQHTLEWKKHRFYDTVYEQAQFVDYETVLGVYLGTYTRKNNSGTSGVKCDTSRAIIRFLSEKYSLPDNWHEANPTNEEYASFKKLLAFFVTQLNINNDLVQGEKRYVDSGKPNARRFIAQWRFSGFELTCKFAKGYQKNKDNASYINYIWVNINPHYNKESNAVESLLVNVKPEMKVKYKGQPYSIDALDLFNDNEPNDTLKAMFVEFRNKIFEWQTGIYSNEQTYSENTGSKNTSLFEDLYLTSIKSDFSRNRILFGAPGTGKSFMLEQDRKTLLGEENEFNYERVTFHPDYSYANFVGTYKPVPCLDEEGRRAITYEYVPGPFMRIFVKALRNSMNRAIEGACPFLLIIEEINRANVAAVFGDVFQLLDRNDEDESEYPIGTSMDMRQYLAEELGGSPNDYSSIRIPNNMFIWATMNSADQGVFPMDTAFKRRWDFTYLGIDDNDYEIRGKYVKLGRGTAEKNVEWNSLRKAINSFLAKANINEDKQLGPYFLSKKIVVPVEGDQIDASAFVINFKNKVIMYLFEDAAKQKRQTLFSGCSNGKTRYSEICLDFDEKGIGIFHQDIISQIIIKIPEESAQ